jgi:hypothetical protein
LIFSYLNDPLFLRRGISVDRSWSFNLRKGIPADRNGSSNLRKGISVSRDVSANLRKGVPVERDGSFNLGKSIPVDRDGSSKVRRSQFFKGDRIAKVIQGWPVLIMVYQVHKHISAAPLPSIPNIGDFSF